MYFSDIGAQLFDDHTPPPREEFVLNQGFIRDLDRCRRLLPDPRMLPPELNGGVALVGSAWSRTLVCINDHRCP
jgi:hypothetical protein